MTEEFDVVSIDATDHEVTEQVQAARETLQQAIAAAFHAYSNAVGRNMAVVVLIEEERCPDGEQPTVTFH